MNPEKPDGARDIAGRKEQLDSGAAFDLHAGIKLVIEAAEFWNFEQFQNRVLAFMEMNNYDEKLLRAESPADNVIQLVFKDGTALRMEFMSTGEIVVNSGYWSSAQRSVN